MGSGMKQKTFLGSTLGATAIICAPALAHACSVCLTGDSGPMADAYNWSVLFLMATPYAVMGAVGAWLAYKYRRGAKENRVARERSVAQLTLNYKEN